MAVEVLMPALSPTMTEGKLAKGCKWVGDAVKPGDILAVIETGKAIMERWIVARVVGPIDAHRGDALPVQRLTLGCMVIEIAGVTEHIVQTARLELAVQRMRPHPLCQAQP